MNSCLSGTEIFRSKFQTKKAESESTRTLNPNGHLVKMDI